MSDEPGASGPGDTPEPEEKKKPRRRFGLRTFGLLVLLVAPVIVFAWLEYKAVPVVSYTPHGKHTTGPDSTTLTAVLGWAVAWCVVALGLASAFDERCEERDGFFQATVWLLAGAISAGAVVVLLGLRALLTPTRIESIIMDPAHLSTVSCKPRDKDDDALFRDIPPVERSRIEAFEELSRRVQ